MSGLESFVLSYVLNSLWQVPLVMAAAWIAARAARPAGPAMEHRVWVGALLGETLLPALSLLPWERLHMVWPWHLRQDEGGAGNVLVQMGPGAGSVGLHLPTVLFIGVSLAYAALTLYFAARFLWRWWRVAVLMRAAEAVELSDEAALSWRRWLTRFGLGPVALVSSAEVFAPLTMGIASKCVMLPATMITNLREADLDTVVGHELAHVRRADFVKNLLYELLALPVSYHPGVWFARQRMMESREMVCDEMAAGVSGNREYAESLLRLASLLLQGKAVRIPYAIGVFDSSTLERRLMKLTEKKREIGRMRRFVSLGACVALGVATATSALALRIGVDQKDAADNQALSKSIPISVPAKEMQAQVISKVPPVYPPEAKKARIQGKIILEAVIGMDGHVLNTKLVSGPGALQASAQDAVRQWVYKPYLVNGNPVEVKTKIMVFYTLSK